MLGECQCWVSVSARCQCRVNEYQCQVSECQCQVSECQCWVSECTLHSDLDPHIVVYYHMHRSPEKYTPPNQTMTHISLLYITVCAGHQRRSTRPFWRHWYRPWITCHPALSMFRPRKPSWWVVLDAALCVELAVVALLLPPLCLEHRPLTDSWSHPCVWSTNP